MLQTMLSLPVHLYVNIPELHIIKFYFPKCNGEGKVALPKQTSCLKKRAGNFSSEVHIAQVNIG